MAENKAEYTITFPVYTSGGELGKMTLKAAKRGHARIIQAALVAGGIAADAITVTVNKAVDLTPRAKPAKTPKTPKTPKAKK